MGKTQHKPKRKENRFGCISKLSGTRRNPWRARAFVSCMYDEEKGRYIQEYKTIGYFHTYTEAENALHQFNNSPYDIDAVKLTFGELYDKWSDEAFESIGESSVQSYKAAFLCCKEIENVKFIEIRASHLQRIIDSCGKNYPTLRKIKLLFTMMYKWAQKNDLCDKNIGALVDISKYKDRNPNGQDHFPFSPEEIETVWTWAEKNEYVSVMLMMIYSGVRIQELIDLEKEDVHLEEKYFYIRKSKTPSGVRNVPIADKVYPFFESWYNRNPNNTHLITNRTGGTFNYSTFKGSYWQPLIAEMRLNPEHRPHDTRHTCASLLATVGVDERISRKILGHSGKSITEQVYTHYEMQSLLDAINQI